MAILKVANIHFDTAGTTVIRANGANTLTFNTAGTEDARIDPAGNVLIGRTNSTVGQGVKLDVNGAINASAVLVNGAPLQTTTLTSNVVISVADNTNAALRITQTGTGEAIRVEDSANPDATPFIVDANGKVGIGRSPRPFYAIDVYDPSGPSIVVSAETTGNTAENVAFFRAKVDNYDLTVGTGGDGLSFIYQYGGSKGLQIDSTTTPASAGRIFFSINSTEHMRIENSGNVLIGRNNSTVGLGVKLDVAGGVNASSILINGSSIIATLDGANTITGAAFTQANTARNQGNTAFLGANAALIQANTARDQGNTAFLGANASLIQANTARDQANAAFTQANSAFLRANSTTYTSNVVISVADNTNAALRITQTGTGQAIRVEDEANPDSTAFVVDTTGKVGIGTSGPNVSLEVNNAVEPVEIRTTIGGVTKGQITNYNNDMYFTNAGAGSEVFFNNGSERARIDASGNVLIGRTNSTVGLGVKLDVNGAVNASALYVNGAPLSGGATIIDDTVNATRYVTFVDATSGTMTKANVDTTLTFNPSTGTLSATVFNSTSDETLKYDVKPIDNALAYLDEFNGVHFKWKKTDEPSLGVIAQDVEKVLPELIGTDGNYKTVNYNGIIAVLIQAVKELKAEIEVLKNR